MTIDRVGHLRQERRDLQGFLPDRVGKSEQVQIGFQWKLHPICFNFGGKSSSVLVNIRGKTRSAHKLFSKSSIDRFGA